MQTSILAVLTLAALNPAPIVSLPLSDQVGVYGLITKVHFHPNAESAESVRIHGAFAVAEGPHGNYYRSPKWGVLAFKLDPQAIEKCRVQWRDLAAVAGSGQSVGFGFRYRQRGVRVWSGTAAKIKDVPFETGMGIRKARNVNYGPMRQLQCLPRPYSPVMGQEPVQCGDGRRPERRIELVVDNCKAKDEGLRYLFEIERPGGDIQASGLIDPGKERTSWTAWVALRPGEEVKWRCRVVVPGLKKAPVVQARFQTVGNGQARKKGGK